MNRPNSFLLSFSIVMVFSLSGCGTIHKQYADRTVRAEVKAVSKVSENKTLTNPKLKEGLPAAAYEALQKEKESSYAVATTTNPPLSKGISWSWTYINPVAVSKQKPVVGDVVDIRIPPIDEKGQIQDIPRVMSFVCKVEDADYEQCFKDPKRGGRYGIINEQTGDISNF